MLSLFVLAPSSPLCPRDRRYAGHPCLFLAVHVRPEKLLGFGSGTDFLTNAELLEYLHPMLDKTNYIYDDFTTWGTCTDWDPCPSCSMAALERMESRTSREKGDKGHKGPSKPGMRASNSRS